MTAEELKAIIEDHRKWIFGEKGGIMANLSGANLSETDLSETDLSRANLFGANLSGADLSETDLSGANLFGANLSETKWGEGFEQPIFIGPIGSRNDYLFCQKQNGKLFIRTGCFFGSIDQFEDQVKKVHKDSRYGKNYLAAIQMLRTIGE